MADAVIQSKVDTIVRLAEEIAQASPQSAEPALRIARIAQELHEAPDRPTVVDRTAADRADRTAAPPPSGDVYEGFSRLEPGPSRPVTPFLHVLAGAQGSLAHPSVRKVEPSELRNVLAEGLDDFWEMPTHVLFLCVIYPILGVVLAGFTFSYNVLPLLYPLAAGFALVGPLAAIGLYELSRRREQGLPTDWKYAFEVLRSPAMTSIAALGLVLLVIFLAWLTTAEALYTWLYGYRPVTSLPAFVAEALTTSRGWTLIILGNAIGFVFAVVALAISVVSFPLLLDRDVGLACAVQTSIRAVVMNPATMGLWGLIVAGLLAIGSVPAFVGLAVAMPVLGHSTWHLYRRVVAPGEPRDAARMPDGTVSA